MLRLHRILEDLRTSNNDDDDVNAKEIDLDKALIGKKRLSKQIIRKYFSFELLPSALGVFL